MEMALNITEIKPGTEKDYFLVNFIGRLNKQQTEILVSLSSSGIINVKV
jgi:hypothetical protein|tara:strand:+ start:170 stop:316 length:147 start_codon:yes stop_codon:yes gene_type:complete